MNNRNELRRRMKLAGWNVTELARRAKLDRGTTGKILSGYFDRKIAQALGIVDGAV